MTPNTLSVLKATNNALTKAERDSIWQDAGVLIKGGLYPDKFKSQESAFIVALYGREYGMTPQTSWNKIHLIKNQPSLHVHEQVSRVRQVYPAMIWRVVEHDFKQCVIEHGRTKDDLSRTSFTLEEAKMAGLLEPSQSGKPSNWMKSPKDMLYARAAGRAVRWFYPETQGSILYNTDEMMDVQTAPATLAEQEAKVRTNGMPKRDPNAPKPAPIDAAQVIDEAKPTEATAAVPNPEPIAEAEEVHGDQKALSDLQRQLDECSDANAVDRVYGNWRAGQKDAETLVLGFDMAQSRTNHFSQA